MIAGDGFDPGYAVFRNVEISMRDGTSLSADIYFPDASGPVDQKRYPTVLIRTPYDKAQESALVGAADRLTGEGYVLVFQDVRGTNTSSGVLDPMSDESWGDRQDGADTVDWIIRQPWSNGQVATCGSSYLGGVQLLLMTMDVPGLKTGFVQVPAVNQFRRGWVYNGEMLDLGTALIWATAMAGVTVDKLEAPVRLALAADEEEAGVTSALALLNVPAVYEKLKGRSLRDALIARHVPFWQRWLDGRDDPEAFKNSDLSDRYGKVKVPLMHFGGWYDLFNRNSIEAYCEIIAKATEPAARKGQRLWIGPWGHSSNPEFRQFPNSEVDDLGATIAWFNQQLRDIAHPAFEHPILIYVMGENRWRAEETWPLAGTQTTRFYLHSNGSANGVRGDGVLSTVPPVGHEPADTYVADPSDPAPSIGGQSVFGGPREQSNNDQRTDILSYTSEPMSEDVEVTGWIRATINASSSATDTDWFVKLIDVFPDGTSYNLIVGGTRARYRGSRTEPAPLVPDAIEAYEIDLWATSNVFKKGHRIRVQISSADYPNSDLNPNAFIDISEAGPADYVVAQNSIFHDADFPSWIELPVIPADRERQWVPAPFASSRSEPHYLRDRMEMVPGPAPVELDKNVLPRVEI